MAFVLGNKVRQASTTGGNGTITLDVAAPTGSRTFAAGIGTGNTTLYCIDEGTAGTDFEIGLGTVTVGGTTTLSRDTVIISSNGTSKISWPSSGQRNVFTMLPAELISSLLDPSKSAGIVCRTSSALATFNFENRVLSASNGLAVTNGNGVSGNPTVHPSAWETKTGGFTASVGGRYRIDGGASVVPPASPSDGDEFHLWDYKGEFLSNPAVIDYDTRTTDIMGAAEDYELNMRNAKITVAYVSALTEWRVY